METVYSKHGTLRRLRLVACRWSAAHVATSFKLATIGSQAFPVAAAKIWKALSDNVVSSSSVEAFRYKLKTFVSNYPSVAAITYNLDYLVFTASPIDSYELDKKMFEDVCIGQPVFPSFLLHFFWTFRWELHVNVDQVVFFLTDIVVSTARRVGGRTLRSKRSRCYGLTSSWTHWRHWRSPPSCPQRSCSNGSRTDAPNRSSRAPWWRIFSGMRSINWPLFSRFSLPVWFSKLLVFLKSG